MRHRLSLLVLVALGLAAAGRLLQAQQPMSEEERKRQFLRAREEMLTVPATPSPTSVPTPKPKPKPRATPEPTPRPTPMPAIPAPHVATPRPAPEVTPRPRTKPEPTPRPRESTPLPRVTPAPVTPVPATPFQGITPVPAPVTIEKSGYEESRGLQPATAPGGGWFSRWKYLSRSVRAELDRAPVERRRWRYIVVHNSGTRQGNARAFDYYHLHVRRMVNGLAYHFVIGNGTSSGDGEVEVGNRWRRQIQGGHVHSDFLNNIALGICLVGDFNRDVPSARQMAALDELIRYLRSRVGKIDGKEAIVKAHRDINPPRWPTDCPGNNFKGAWLGKYQ